MAGPAPVLPDMFRSPAGQAGNARARGPTHGREEVKPGRQSGREVPPVGAWPLLWSKQDCEYGFLSTFLSVLRALGRARRRHYCWPALAARLARYAAGILQPRRLVGLIRTSDLTARTGGRAVLVSGLTGHACARVLCARQVGLGSDSVLRQSRRR